ncbi:MAG: polysaccharide biosynthesis C-terminal domain-containing protein [Flavobacteriales bacterium]|nr:polysaccharide biosynthesis C-terminal domain-containing protein [Flavobacteriales bacterium]
MLNKIIHTLGSRFIIVILSLGMLIITTKILGAEVKGEISLLILNLSIVSIISGFLGGPALVYLASRESVRNILRINLIWSIIASSAATFLLYESEMLQFIEPIRFFRMGLMESLIATNLMLLLGKERVQRHNVIQVLKVIATLLPLIILIEYVGKTSAAFIYAYEISLVLSLIASIWSIKSFIKSDPFGGSILQSIQSCLKFGALVQLGNVTQLFNYRLSYYFLEILISPPQLALIRIGIYSASMQVAESLWQFTRSVNTVQYSSVANIKDRAAGLKLSLQLVRLNYSVTLIGVILILLVPISLFEMAFGAEFGEIKNHFLYLSPGIVALAFGGAINHFFAGVGDHRYNTINSVLGFLITLCIVYPLVSRLGTIGAAVGASVVYLIQAAIQVWFLKRSDGIEFSSFYLTASDLSALSNKLKEVWNRISSKS